MKTPTRSSKDNERQAITDKLKQARIVAIIRLTEQHLVQDVVRCLVDGGITALEITSNTKGFSEEVSSARKAYPNILIGAGTILNLELAEQAIQAGAQFLVTPNTQKSVVEVAHQHGTPVLMGAFTPTEVAQALSYDADIVKLFPAGDLGISYYKSLLGPFDQATIFPVGGINLDNIRDWFDAGVKGVGVGNDLTRAVYNESDKLALTAHVKKYLAAIS